MVWNNRNLFFHSLSFHSFRNQKSKITCKTVLLVLDLPRDPATPLLGIYSVEMKTNIHIKIGTQMFNRSIVHNSQKNRYNPTVHSFTVLEVRSLKSNSWGQNQVSARPGSSGSCQGEFVPSSFWWLLAILGLEYITPICLNAFFSSVSNLLLTL